MSDRKQAQARSRVSRPLAGIPVEPAQRKPDSGGSEDIQPILARSVTRAYVPAPLPPGPVGGKA